MLPVDILNKSVVSQYALQKFSTLLVGIQQATCGKSDHIFLAMVTTILLFDKNHLTGKNHLLFSDPQM